MTDPLDPDQEDYNDRQTGPLPGVPQPTDQPAQWRPLRTAMVVGFTFAFAGLCWIGFEVGKTRLSDSNDRRRSANNLKNIGLAIQSYYETNGELPGNTYDSDGKPLLSWRVHILPYLEYDNLYKQFRLDEAWDGPNNIQLLKQMPYYHYAGPRDIPSTGLTHYRGFSSPGAVFDRKIVIGKPRPAKDHLSFDQFADGAGNTILVVEAGDPIEWSKHDDLDASPDKPFPKMGGMGWRNVFQALMADGSVRSFKLDMPPDKLRAWVTHSGGENVPLD